MDLNHRSSAYEADEIPLLYPATVKVSVYLFPQCATECYCSSSSWILSRQRYAHNTYTERLVRRLLFMFLKMVPSVGFELTTCALQVRCSTKWAKRAINLRTIHYVLNIVNNKMATSERFELPTLKVEASCSIQLSYEAIENGAE